MSQDLPVVYYAADVAEADIVISWLAARGYAAVMKDRHAAGTLHVPQVVNPEGIEVCALDPKQAEPARQELLHHFDQLDAPEAARSTDPVDAECEECGKITTFPAAHRGKVENCPHCHAYIDVPE